MAKGNKHPDTHQNPYEVLDNFIQHVCEKDKHTRLSSNYTNQHSSDTEIAILKAEVGLLQNQVRPYMRSVGT